MTKKEAQETFQFLVKTTVEVLSISTPEAEKRVKKLMTMDFLNYGDQHDPQTQRKIDIFLQIPSRKHHEPLPYFLESEAYQQAFLYSIQNKDVVSNYDRLSGTHLYDVLETMQRGGINFEIDKATGRTTDEIQKFEVFFRECIWSRFQHSQNQVKYN